MAARYHEETLGKTIIPIINKLQDIFSQISSTDVRLDLPQVAVVGSQSSGKSSVLEALVGRDFLPRGSNIVTRRPLILQLIKTSKEAEWGEFLHLPGKRFHDFDRIRQEISVETERLVGTNKGVSEKPIRLKIYSPNVLTMTLIDLPGLTRVPVGDQPEDIESRLRSLILKYVSSPSCIILAVSPANQDLASSDALDIARQADPEGLRTIGVLTKLDIMDRGTDATAALRNEVIPLRLGYVGVVLRSQEDIEKRRSMAESRENEKIFFQSRSEYATLASHCGIATLARSLNAILVNHIREALPSLRSRLEDAASARKRELRMLGDAPPGSTGAARGALLLSILDSYSARFAAMLDGHGDHLPINELAGGARIRHIFLDIFSAGLDSLDPTAELTDEDVRTAIKNSGGIKGSLLIPEAPFELLVRRAIERLLAPSLQCKEFVHAELLRIAAQCVPPEVGRFPTLHSVLSEAVEDLVNAGSAPADSMIRNLIECELAYINTSHPQFVGGNRAIAEVLGRRSCCADGNDTLPAHRPYPTRNNSSNAIPRAHPVVTSSPDGLAAAAKMAMNSSAAATTTAPAIIQPELFRPEELLQMEAKDLQGKMDDNQKGWFSHWFSNKGSHGNGGDHGLADVLAGSERAPTHILSHTATATLESRHHQGIDANYNNDSSSSPNGSNAILNRPPSTLKVPQNASDQESVQVEVTRVLVESYFDIVRKNLQDAVPKAIMNFLVGSTRKCMQQHLIRTLYREDLLSELMKERNDVAMRRQACQESLRALRTAIKTLESMPSEIKMTERAHSMSGAKWNFKSTVPGGTQFVDENSQYIGKKEKNSSTKNSSPLKSGLREQQ